MNDVCFNMYNLSFVPGACLETENKVKESIVGLAEVAHKLKNEITEFSLYGKKVLLDIQGAISEVSSMISAVGQKASSAQSKKQQEVSPPAKPSVPADATPEKKAAIAAEYQEKAARVQAQNEKIREQNGRVDEYVSRCNAAKSELEEILAKLHEIESAARGEIESATSRAHELLRRTNDSVNQNATVNVAMKEFCYVFDRAYEAAQKLYEMKPSEIRGHSYVDRIFEIRNTHHGRSSSGGPGFRFSTGESAESTALASVKTKKSDEKTDELLVKARDEDSFFEAAKGASRIKMPSGNLHKLGGKAFLAKMKERGFVTMAQSDGSTIDLNGMIHWERKDG